MYSHFHETRNRFRRYSTLSKVIQPEGKKLIPILGTDFTALTNNAVFLQCINSHWIILKTLSTFTSVKYSHAHSYIFTYFLSLPSLLYLQYLTPTMCQIICARYWWHNRQTIQTKQTCASSPLTLKIYTVFMLRENSH